MFVWLHALLLTTPKSFSIPTIQHSNNLSTFPRQHTTTTTTTTSSKTTTNSIRGPATNRELGLYFDEDNAAPGQNCPTLT